MGRFVPNCNCATASQFQFVALTERESEIAAEAYAQFGKGRHPAALNMGDCFAYACAKSNKAKLLYKGTDFAKTDLAWRSTAMSRKSLEGFIATHDLNEAHACKEAAPLGQRNLENLREAPGLTRTTRRSNWRRSAWTRTCWQTQPNVTLRKALIG